MGVSPTVLGTVQAELDMLGPADVVTADAATRVRFLAEQSALLGIRVPMPRSWAAPDVAAFVAQIREAHRPPEPRHRELVLSRW